MIPSTTVSLSSRGTKTWIDKIPALSDDPTHPVQIILRTYALSLSLSLGPALIPFVTSFAASRHPRARFSQLVRILRRELGWDGFAFAITLSVGGGAAIKRFWESLKEASSDFSICNQPAVLPTHTSWARWRSVIRLLDLTPVQTSFLSNVLSSSIGIFLLQAGRQRVLRLRQSSSANTTLPFTPPVGRDHRTSPTLDLTLLLFVRAMDAAVQTIVSGKCESADIINCDTNRVTNAVSKNLLDKRLQKDRRKKLQYYTSKIDAFIFWVCSARIMWCFFYEPQRLPRSYVTWIGTLANLDKRVIRALQLLREGRWSYINGSAINSKLLSIYAAELGHPASWGDPRILPSHGSSSDSIWESLGVSNRRGIGGLPCEIVHGQVGTNLGLASSCTVNSGLRGLKAFVEAVAIYLPAHFIPILLTRPGSLLQPQRTLSTLVGALRSASFLSTFVASYWYTVCITRTLVFARLFPSISHDFWDGPYGCVLAGCLVCGSSIWIENGRRRGEMALYVLPRAVRACLPDTWVKRGNRGFRILERITFVLSISSLLTAGAYKPGALRGLSRWTLSFIINGPNASFWKRKHRDPSDPSTPFIPSTPIIPEKIMLPVTENQDAI